MATKPTTWTHQFKWGNPYTRPPQGDVLLIEIETDSQETPPEIERLRPAYPPGCGYAHILYCNKEVARWSEERKAKARKTREINRIKQQAPLFADELIERLGA